MQKKADQPGAAFVVVDETLSPAKTPDPSGSYAFSVDSSAVAVGQELRRMGSECWIPIKCSASQNAPTALGSSLEMVIPLQQPIDDWHVPWLGFRAAP